MSRFSYADCARLLPECQQRDRFVRLARLGRHATASALYHHVKTTHPSADWYGR
jgi:hypothetical protein